MTSSESCADNDNKPPGRCHKLVAQDHKMEKHPTGRMIGTEGAAEAEEGKEAVLSYRWGLMLKIYARARPRPIFR